MQTAGRPQNKAGGLTEGFKPTRCASGAVQSTANERAPEKRKDGFLARRAATATDQASTRQTKQAEAVQKYA